MTFQGLKISRLILVCYIVCNSCCTIFIVTDIDKELSEFVVKEEDALNNLSVVPISKKEVDLVGVV